MIHVEDLCCQEMCCEIATHNFVWPGYDKKPICLYHLFCALNIGQAIGITIYHENKIYESNQVTNRDN